MIEDEVVLAVRLSCNVDVCSVVYMHDIVYDVHVLSSLGRVNEI